jgi:hypothetical protein
MRRRRLRWALVGLAVMLAAVSSTLWLRAEQIVADSARERAREQLLDAPWADPDDMNAFDRFHWRAKRQWHRWFPEK